MRRLLRLTLLALALAAPLAAEQWGFWDYGPGAFGDQAWKEPVANLAALPASGNEIGDVRVTLDDLAAHVWDGDSWEAWAGGGGSGTVTSIALAVPAEWTVSGSPVTTSGTITIAEATQTANTVYAGPTTGAAATPGFRALVDDDLPAAALADDQAATEVPYTPTTASDWTDPDPTHAGGALDALAARLTTEEGKADDDVPESGDFGAATDLDADGAVSANAVALGTDTTGDYVSSATASQGLTLTGTEGASLGLQDCAATEVLKRNAGDTAWECAADATGAGIGGSTGATDDAILIADGTGGSTLAASAATLTAAGSLTIPSGQQVLVNSAVGLIYDGINGGFPNDATLRVSDGSTGTATVSAGRYFMSYGGNYVILQASSWGISVRSSDDSHYVGVVAEDIQSWSGAANKVYVYPGGTPARVGLSSDAQVAWESSTTTAYGTPDVGIARNAAGVVRITDGTTGIGSLLASVLVEANTAGSGTPNAIAATESGTVFTNEGATAKNYHTLPTAVAGYTVTFVVQDADGLRVTAAAGDDIRIGATTSTTAGYCESTTVGDSVTLVAINATNWFATALIGSGWTCAIFFPSFRVRRRLRELLAANDNTEQERRVA